MDNNISSQYNNASVTKYAGVSCVGFNQSEQQKPPVEDGAVSNDNSVTKYAGVNCGRRPEPVPLSETIGALDFNSSITNNNSVTKYGGVGCGGNGYDISQIEKKDNTEILDIINNVEVEETQEFVKDNPNIEKNIEQ